MRWSRLSRYSRRRLYHLFQAVSGYGIDNDFAAELASRADVYLDGKQVGGIPASRPVPVGRASVDLSDAGRYQLVRDDIYKRFVPAEEGSERDSFGRSGRWTNRGCRIYLDLKERDYVKVFDRHFCLSGEGRFLPAALEAGVYDFLCPHLQYTIVDGDDTLVGYAIREGRPLSSYEFHRYVCGSLRSLICEVTRSHGFYFYDLEFHNFIRSGNQLSLIDLESVLPLEWFGQDLAFAKEHLDVIDIGWPLQQKWRSPRWYRDFLVELVGSEGIHPPSRRSSHTPSPLHA